VHVAALRPPAARLRACVLNVATANEPARRLYYGTGFEYVCETRMVVFA